MNYRFYLPILILLCTLTSAHGSTDRPAISGVGAMSCGKWIEFREMKSKEINNFLVAWFQGFLSGMNTQGVVMKKEEMLIIPDPPTLLAYVDKACKDSPLDSVFSISIRLCQDIQKK